MNRGENLAFNEERIPTGRPGTLDLPSVTLNNSLNPNRTQSPHPGEEKVDSMFAKIPSDNSLKQFCLSECQLEER